MRAFALAVLAALLAACSTAQSRIHKHQAQFDAYPPEVQDHIRHGQVDPGFTFEQVEMALGAPDRSFSETSPGHTREIWSYGGGSEPAVGFGFGYGTWHHGGGMGTTVAVGGPGPYADPDDIRVTFEDGRVINVRRRNR